MTAKLISDFEKILEESNFCDVILNCKGKVFYLHKVILSARSPVFAAMFNSDMEEMRCNEVDVVDIEPEVMTNLLSFIYCGKFTNKEICCDLYVAADKYQIEDLMEECYQHILRTINEQTVIKYLKFADTYNRKGLTRLSIQYMLNEMDEEKVKAVIFSEDCKNMISQCPTIFSEIFLLIHASNKKLKEKVDKHKIRSLRSITNHQSTLTSPTTVNIDLATRVTRQTNNTIQETPVRRRPY